MIVSSVAMRWDVAQGRRTMYSNLCSGVSCLFFLYPARNPIFKVQKKLQRKVSKIE